MTGHLMLGAIVALIVELAFWVKVRWEFNESAGSRAWQFTMVLIALAGTLIYLDGNPYVALPNLLTWMPALLLPMQFVQQYGLQETIPLNTFSFLANHRRKRNLRLGLTEGTIRVNFGNFYFVTTMVAATLGKNSSSPAFLPGIVFLTGWMLLSASRSRPASLIFSLLVAASISVAGQRGIDELKERFHSSPGGRSTFDPNNVFTLIGKPGEIVQSPEILWRLRPRQGTPVPRLLRTATYNTYRTGPWGNLPPPAKDFKDLLNRDYEGIPYLILAEEISAAAQIRLMRESLPRFGIRGSAAEETPLPLPGNVASLRDFDLDGIEQNSFGSVRIFPKSSVIEGTVLWNGDITPEVGPFTDADLMVPVKEREVLKRIVAELKLEELPTLQAKMATVRNWFGTNFRYSRDLSIKSSNQVAQTPTAIAQFLTTVRSGHCEYFATATALLLRSASIPTRYSVGYAVVERDRKNVEYLVRGTHGHAWTRVWDAESNQWIDFDTTPPSWIPEVTSFNTLTQRISDTFQTVREDFFLWRNRPNNRLGATIVMTLIALAIAGYIAKRLWKSKRHLNTKDASQSYIGPSIKTPLNDLESRAELLLGPRPAWRPYGAWLNPLAQSLANPKALEEAIAIHQRLRFDPAAAEPQLTSRLAQLTKELVAQLKK